MAKCADHLGNQYDSFDKMCKIYGLSPSTVRGRMKSGKSLQASLSGGKYKTYGPYIVDHFGNSYRSLEELKRAWNIGR